jgi:hypothetical protein
MRQHRLLAGLVFNETNWAYGRYIHPSQDLHRDDDRVKK